MECVDPFPRLQKPPNIPYRGISTVHSLQLRGDVIVPRVFPCKDCTLQELCNECAVSPGISAVAAHQTDDENDDDSENDESEALYNLASDDDGENSDGDSDSDSEDNDEDDDDDDDDNDHAEDREDETNSLVWAPSGYALIERE